MYAAGNFGIENSTRYSFCDKQRIIHRTTLKNESQDLASGRKKMAIKIALAGNPNCGKTTMFNALTGANQYVGNWPGVTV